MRIAANLLLPLAALLTLPLFPLVDSLRRAAGPDRSGADIQFVFLCVPRWILLAIALMGLVPRGAFDWIPGPRGLIVFALHLAMGIVSLGALLSIDRPSALR